MKQDTASGPLARQQMDRLQYVVCGKDYTLAEGFVIRNPSLREIAEYGEAEFIHLVQMLLAKPQDMMVFLDDMGMDFEAIDAYQFSLSNFLAVPNSISQMRRKQSEGGLAQVDSPAGSSVGILFGGLDISQFVLVNDPATNEPVLHHAAKDFLLTKPLFEKMLAYLRLINNIKEPEKRNFSSGFVKREFIEHERTKARRRQRENKGFESILACTISRMVNTCGFPYNYQTVFDLKISQFYDALAQLQSISEYEHLMSGIYAGTVQYDKVSDKSILSWMKINT